MSACSVILGGRSNTQKCGTQKREMALGTSLPACGKLSWGSSDCSWLLGPVGWDHGLRGWSAETTGKCQEEA